MDPTLKETIESMIRGQRRMRGTIVSVDPDGCRIVCELGEFPFSIAAVKENKRFPDRLPRAGDRCDFKLSDTNPVKATSIRVVVPKTEGSPSPSSSHPRDSLSEQRDAEADAALSSSASPTGPIAPSNSSSPVVATSANCVVASGFSGGGTQEGSSGLDDLCSAFQRMGKSSGSLFSN